MPRRAIISALFILSGTLSGFATPINTAARNTSLQPRTTLNVQVLKPAQARILGSGQLLAKFNVQKITPVWQTPAVIKLSRTAFNQPGGAVVRPAVVKAAGGS